MQNGTKIKNIVPEDLVNEVVNVDDLVKEFAQVCNVLEKDSLHVFVDARTLARFCECHIPASKLVVLSTIDVPLDPDEQPEYRANREIVTSHEAFETMKKDAMRRRSFSNIVVEYTKEFDAEHPLKIIGGQHRFEAIKLAYEQGKEEHHGIKVYFGLNSEQRLDVQLISNTVITVSTDLFDRMQETVKGPELRNWCQEVGLLEKDQDFSDKRQRGFPITVRAARTFIINYYLGQSLASDKFDEIETTSILCKSGAADERWEKLRDENPRLWNDPKLKSAGQQFARLIQSQRRAFSGSGKKEGRNVDFEEKALNYAILSSWAFVAGILHKNEKRLNRHFSLADRTGKDPLNAAALAKGKHKTDAANYRGLGYRTDPRERGRFVELFYLQAETGDGISPSLIDWAIKKYYSKEAFLDVKEAAEKAQNK